MKELSAQESLSVFRRFTRTFGIFVCLIVGLPVLFGVLIKPENTAYLGLHFNFDDHMVYAGWMRQAMEGRILFENRFTTDAQPGLTLHLWFLLLGWVAKILGIPVTMFVARLVTTFFAVVLLGRLIERVTSSVFAQKLALGLTVFGGGLGFLAWHNFGRVITKPESEWMRSLTLGFLPTDVWQPEGFFFPSALTNGLFMISLILILGVLLSILNSRESVRAVIPGAVCMGVLMNIHSYDVLLIALVVVGFLVSLIVAKEWDAKWVARGVLIGAGAIPFALWFVYVLKNDPVFQARAATETFSPNFRSVVAGYFFLIVLGLGGIYIQAKKRSLAPVLSFILICLMYGLATNAQEGYFMQMPVWTILILAGFIACTQLGEMSPGMRLVCCWAILSLIIPYFPGLFQRKLFMMTALPWGILAAVFIAHLMEHRERNHRNLAAALSIILLSGTSIQWVVRELKLIKSNVSTTGMHTVYLNTEVQKMLQLTAAEGRNVVVACEVGGLAIETDAEGKNIPDGVVSPPIPDLNPLFVGLNGNRAYAGHWSETPKYGERRSEVMRALSTFNASRMKELGITHAIFFVPRLDASPNQSLDSVGQVMMRGSQWALVKL